MTIRPVDSAHIHSLDGLRTIAILFVVLYHLHVPAFVGGFIGVNVFFVLSGYLITSILLREREASGRIRLPRFWLRRLLRLYPALVALVIASALLWPLVSHYEGANVDALGAALLALTYTGNIGRWIWHHSMGVLSQTWSLGMEEQFYLVWPPILAILLAKRARVVVVCCVLAALVVVSSVWAAILYRPHAGTATPDIYFSPILNVAPLLMGCILAIALTRPRFAERLAGRIGALCAWVGIAAVVIIPFAIPHGWQKDVATFALVLPASGLAAMVLIGGLVSRRTVVGRVLGFAPIAWFGSRVSYSLYLWHVLVLALLLPIFPGLGGKFIVLGAAVAVAVGSHFAIERPFLAIKRRLEPRLERRAAEPPHPERDEVVPVRDEEMVPSGSAAS